MGNPFFPHGIVESKSSFVVPYIQDGKIYNDSRGLCLSRHGSCLLPKEEAVMKSGFFGGLKKDEGKESPVKFGEVFFVQCTSTKRLRGWAWLMWIVFQVSVSIHGPFLRIQPHKHEPSYGHFLAQGTLVLK